MARLKVQEAALARGINLSQLHVAINQRMAGRNKPVALGTVRRYWYSTHDGNVGGDPIELVNIHILGTIARVLDVPVADLLNGDELGKFHQARQAA